MKVQILGAKYKSWNCCFKNVDGRHPIQASSLGKGVIYAKTISQHDALVIRRILCFILLTKASGQLRSTVFSMWAWRHPDLGLKVSYCQCDHR